MSTDKLDFSKRVFTFPAQIVRTTPQEELRRLAVERRVFSEEDIQKYNPYFWPATISNNRFDSHSTRMDVSSLRNYAAEAEAGVSFLYSHDNEEIVGHSMGGRFVGSQGNGVAHVDADFYAIPGLQLGTVSSDQVILGIDTKVLRYVSIGFYGGEWICSICGYDVWDWENCRHYPGYMFKVQADGETRDTLCTADVKDAHLAEVSSVYKGSTPGAIITKAEHDARAGLLTPALRSQIERRFHVTLPEKRVSVPGHSSDGERPMPEPKETAGGAERGTVADQDPPQTRLAEQNPPAPPPPTEQSSSEGEALSADEATRQLPLVRQLLVEAGVPDRGDLPMRIRSLISRAQDGTQYRTDLIAEALAEGVRANGASFNQDAYRRTLEGSDLATVKIMRDDWKRQAAEVLKPGRQTRDGEQRPSPKPDVPNSAYKVR